MVSDVMTFEKHSQNLEPLQVYLNVLCDVQHATRKNVRMRAYGEVFICTPHVAFMAVATVWTRKLLK